MKKKLKLLGIAALAVAIGFSMTGCPTSTNGGNGDPSAPASVTVTPPAITVAQGGQRQFTATVGPAGVSQAVTWSIEPAKAGTINNGLFAPTATPGTQVIIRATATSTTVSGTATVTVGQPVTPASVTVTPASAYVGQGGQRQFTATVGPEGAPQAVTWSVAPTGAGSITTGGLLTVTGASVGDTLTITATAVNHPAVSNTATVTVPEPISITVTGISTTHPSTSGEIELRDPETGTRVAGGSGHISGSSATFTLWDRNWDHRFAVPGDYEVSIRFGCCYECDGEHPRVYRIALINITAGTNTIPWSAFSFMPPINITITGIPNQYHGSWAEMGLVIPGTMNYVAWVGDTYIPGSSMTFTLVGASPGIYDVIFVDAHFFEGMENFGIYRAPSRNITAGTNSIPWSAFASVPPSITITVTGIPAEYRNGSGDIELICAETEDWVDWGWSVTEITGASAIFRFFFVDPGTYDVDLWIIGSERWGHIIAPSRSITANTTIPWSAFNIVVNGGDVMSVTVTGIPERYHGNWSRIELRDPGTGNWADDGYGFIEGSSATFRLRDAVPGIYDVTLSFFEFDGLEVRYTLSSRNIYAGASIPFGQFTLFPQGFSESIECSGRVLPDRSNARPSRAHR